MNGDSVNEHLANLLVEAELDEYRVANYQVALIFMKSIGDKLRQVNLAFACNAFVVPWEQALRSELMRHDGVTVAGRQEFLGDLFLLFGHPIHEVVTKPDGSLCLKFNEKQAVVLHIAEEDLDADDWIWRVEAEQLEGGGVSCAVMQVDGHWVTKLLVK